jgi:3-oxoadipate enol-lactonase
MNQVKVDNIELAFDDTGDGPAVVLIHGYPFNRSLWTEQIEALQAILES